MDWESILKRKRMNVDVRNHDDIILDLKRDINELIEKAHNDFGDIADDMIKDYGMTDLKEYLEFMDRLLKNELPMTIHKTLTNASSSANRLLKETFDMYSPSTEGEMRAEAQAERMADSQRELDAERYYGD